jgi:hypothetical protein
MRSRDEVRQVVIRLESDASIARHDLKTWIRRNSFLFFTVDVRTMVLATPISLFARICFIVVRVVLLFFPTVRMLAVVLGMATV